MARKANVPLTAPQIQALISAVVSLEGEWEGLLDHEWTREHAAKKRALDNATTALARALWSISPGRGAR